MSTSSPAVSSRSARREELLAAADRVVRRDGAAASMASIAAAAGITKPVLYRHFGDKDGLYAALAERHTERLREQLQGALSRRSSPRERVERTIDAYLASIESAPQVYRFLLHSPEAAPARGQVRSFVSQVALSLADGIEAELGLPAGSVRGRAWAHGVVGMVQSAGDWWLEERTCSREQLVEELVELIWGAYAREAEARAAGG